MVPAAQNRHLLGLDGVGRQELESLLDQAEVLGPIAAGRAPPLDLATGRIVANLFFEDSTPVRVSFTVAARRLGADSVDQTGSGSSLSKGETLLDTALTVEAMGVAALVVASPCEGTPARIAAAVSCAVINAGDGRHEHPTQGLGDILTLRQRWGDLSGRVIAIVGDIADSRVARSNIHGLTTLGADVMLVGPPSLVPVSLGSIASGPGRVTVVHDLDEVLEKVDVIMMLRAKMEGIAEEDHSAFRLTVARARRLRPEALVMHPGPVNSGVEIDSEVADDSRRSVILRQVANGVAVRMAVLKRSLS